MVAAHKTSLLTDHTILLTQINISILLESIQVLPFQAFFNHWHCPSQLQITLIKLGGKSSMKHVIITCACDSECIPLYLVVKLLNSS